MATKRIIVDSLGRLPAFCHAVIAGGFVYVSGTLGTVAGSITLVEGGVAAETEQALRNIETILKECGVGFGDLVKVNVYLADMADFNAMNDTYVRVLGEGAAARITVGGGVFALGAKVEIDAVAYVGSSG